MCPYDDSASADQKGANTVTQLAAEVSELKVNLRQQIAQVEDTLVVRVIDLENLIANAIKTATKPLLKRIVASKQNIYE